MRNKAGIPTTKKSGWMLATMAMAIAAPASIAATLNAPAHEQSSPVARVIDTAKTFRDSMDIHYGEPLRAVERQSIQAYEMGIRPRLPVFTRPDGEVIVPLEEVIPILQTAPGNFSVIILGKGIKPVSLVGAPSAEWVVKESSAGGHPVLEIMPRFAGLKGSIQVVATSPHGYPLTYTVGLISGASRFTPTLSFYRVHHVTPQPSAIMAMPTKPVAETKKDRAPVVNATQANVNWKVQCATGDCTPIQPVSVISNRKSTFITLPTGKTPMVVVRNKAGKSLFVGYRMVPGKEHILAVDAVPYRIDLLTGSWNHLAQIRLTNEAGE